MSENLISHSLRKSTTAIHSAHIHFSFKIKNEVYQRSKCSSFNVLLKQNVRWDSRGNYNDRLRDSPPHGNRKHNTSVVFDC